MSLFSITGCHLHNRQSVFYIVDAIFLVCGISTLIIGLWLYIDRNHFVELTPTSYSALSAAGLCCFTGATVIIIACIGLAATWMRNQCLMIAFIGFLILLCLVQMVTGIVGLFHKDAARDNVRLDLLGNINRTYVLSHTGEAKELTITWDQLQTTLQCCGAEGPTDWYNSKRWPKNQFVPDSCCDPSFFDDIESMKNCGKVPQTNSHWYSEGCHKLFVDWLFHHIRVVNWMSLTLIIIEVTTLSAAMLVNAELQKIKQKSTRERLRRRLAEINERERQDLQLMPMDRIGDANQEPEDIEHQ